MVRNPVDLAYSHHPQSANCGHEDEGHFEAPWRLRSACYHCQRIPSTLADPKALQNREIAKFSEQVEHLDSQGPRESARVLVLSDLRRNSDHVHQRVLRSVDLARDSRATFPSVNRDRNIRLRGIRRLSAIGSSIERPVGVRRSFAIWRGPSPTIVAHPKYPPLEHSLRAEHQTFFEKAVSSVSDPSIMIYRFDLAETRSTLDC